MATAATTYLQAPTTRMENEEEKFDNAEDDNVQMQPVNQPA